jgi:RimJ/RimL family protein N-acetyltransferase
MAAEAGVVTAPSVRTVVATLELSNPASVRGLENAGFEREAASSRSQSDTRRAAVSG